MKTSFLKFFAISYIVIFMFITGTVFAQSATNITGVFEGARMQYNASHTAVVKEFTYKFELVQHKNVVQGTTTIISDAGNYAEVGIRGIVLKDKFYFEEYRMLDQIKAQGMQWCYKSGVLNISEMNGEIVLSGATPSYMVNYGIACTGGVTKVAAYKENNENINSKASTFTAKELNLNLNIFPNPSTESANLSIELEEETKIEVKILDLSGKTVLTSQTKTAAKGKYQESFNISKFSNGMYIFNININGKVYSKEIVKY